MNRTSALTRRSFLTGVSGLVGATTFPQSTGARQSNTGDYPIGLPFEQLWQFNIAGEEFEPAGQILLARIHDGTIYLVEQYDSRSVIRAIRRHNHETLWTISHDRQLKIPRTGGGWLFACEEDRFVAFQLKGESDEPAWAVETSYDFAYALITGADRVWFLEYQVDEYGDYPDETLVIETANIHCYTHDGTRQWSRDTGIGQLQYADDLLITSAESLRKGPDEDTYTLTSGRVVVRDAGTGDVQWKSSDYNITRATTRNDGAQVIAFGTDGGIYGFDTSSGTEQWQFAVESAPADFAADETRVYIGHDRTITAYNPATDEIEWERQTAPIFDLTYRDQLLYLGDQNGDFHAFDAATGDRVWNYSLIGTEFGYEWIEAGTLYCVSGGRMAAFQGTKGKAIHQLRAAEDNSSLGARFANLIGRDDALASARTAIENENYVAALSAVSRARTLQTVGDGAVWASGGALGYVGTRRATHEYKRRTLENAVEDLQEVYPIAEGVLDGTAPDALLTEATDAVTEIDAAWIGRPIAAGWLHADSYAELQEAVERATSIAPRLADASTTLEEFPTDVQTEWAACLSKTLESGQYDTLAAYLDQFETATELAALRETLEASHTGLATAELSNLITTLLTPSSDLSETDIEYCESASATLESFQEAQAPLANYDLDAVMTKLQDSLEAAPTKREAAIRNFERIQDILAMATTIESLRTDLDLQYLDLTSDDIQADLQHALSHLDVEQLNELESLVENLDAGVWSYSDFQEFNPTEFEHLVAALYDAQGYETEVSQASNDMGIDVMARANGETLAIQVKQYSRGNRVGRPTVQQLAGARDQVNATKGVIVTSSSFTDTAISASQSYGPSMELIDGEDLCRLLTQSPVSPPADTSRGSRRTSNAGSNRQYSGRQNSAGGRSGDSTGGRSRNRGRSAGGAANTGVQYCMTCGQGYRGDLEEVTDPSGKTIYVCARCKELFEQTAAHQQAAKQEAYEILGLSPPVTDDEIESAYREQARETHPDTGGSKDEFLEVQQAYETLIESS